MRWTVHICLQPAISLTELAYIERIAAAAVVAAGFDDEAAAASVLVVWLGQEDTTVEER